MEATVLYGARDVRFEDRPEPTILEPTDAVLRLPFTCICASDLWPFFSHVHLHGGPAPVPQYLPKLIDLVFNGTINPGKVFDLVLPLAQVAEGYRAMDERRAIKTLLQP
jgi:threonine dehydrogenase-like Zn-dependent dehydrogenase